MRLGRLCPVGWRHRFRPLMLVENLLVRQVLLLILRPMSTVDPCSSRVSRRLKVTTASMRMGWRRIVLFRRVRMTGTRTGKVNLHMRARLPRYRRVLKLRDRRCR